MLDITARRTAIAEDVKEARAGYAALWQRVITDWRSSTTGCHAWLTYSANYLFSCNGFKWALDPFSMSSRLAGLTTPDYVNDLAPLSLIVLTHAHNDHLDRGLIAALKYAPVEWVIPEAVQDILKQECELPDRGVITPTPGEEIIRDSLRLTPFESLHFNGGHGVPEMGYLVEMGTRRWLFPGDVREYNLQKLPRFGSLDGVVGHLWLGKARALEAPPPLLDAFCDFFNGFKSEQLFIAHLNEFGRDETEQWRVEHFEMVKAALLERAPQLCVSKFLMGDRMDFDTVRI